MRRILLRIWWFIEACAKQPRRDASCGRRAGDSVLDLQRPTPGTASAPLSADRQPVVFGYNPRTQKDKLVAPTGSKPTEVQLALLPSATPVVPGWDVWLFTQPANDVGGDLVDHLKIDDTRHFVALGDVSGKALPAALLSVKLQATLRALAPQFDNLGDLGSAVNFILQRDGLPSRFASLVYLLLSIDSGHVRVLNAGHMPPLVVRGNTVTAMEPGRPRKGEEDEQAEPLRLGDHRVQRLAGAVAQVCASEKAKLDGHEILDENLGRTSGTGTR